MQIGSRHLLQGWQGFVFSARGNEQPACKGSCSDGEDRSERSGLIGDGE
jgi:hypothetical protein